MVNDKDPAIVSIALDAMLNPIFAQSLEKETCDTILLTLRRRLDPSIQIEAAKLLTNLTQQHCATLQPLIWTHVRQSLTLMDYLSTVDPPRAMIEACVVSNLL
jgi:hypothetical protein